MTPAQIRAQVIIVLLGAPAIWLATTITSGDRWFYIGAVTGTLLICEVLVLRMPSIQSKRNEQPTKHDG